MDEDLQDLASAYLRETPSVCGTREDSPPNAPQTTILDLPNEIIVLIIGGLEEDEELYRVGLLSRRLNALSLPLYLSRRGFGPRPTDQLVFYDYNTPDVLKGLNAALFKQSLTRLCCSLDYDESPEKLEKELKRFGGAIRRLSSLQEATFDFHGVPNDSSPDIIPLLNSILALGCEAMEFSHNGLETFEISFRKDSLLNFSFGFIEKWKNHALSFIPTILYPPKSDSPQDQNIKLQSLSVRSPVLFHPLLFSWTTRLFNFSNVQILSISKQQSVDESSWQLILPCLTIPTLTKLNFDSCLIRLHDLLEFFKRNKGIRKLAFGQNFRLTGTNEPFTVHGFEMNLTYLSSTPHSLVKFLYLIPQVMFTPSLQTLIIHLRMRHGDIFHLGLVDKPLETFYTTFKSIKEMYLSLVFDGIPIDWIVHDENVDPSGNSHHNQVHTLVTDLRIFIKVYNLPSFSSALGIRALLVEFPVLTHLTIRTMSHVDGSFDYQQKVFTRLMKESCPSLKTVNFS